MTLPIRHLPALLLACVLMALPCLCHPAWAGYWTSSCQYTGSLDYTASESDMNITTGQSVTSGSYDSVLGHSYSFDSNNYSGTLYAPTNIYEADNGFNIKYEVSARASRDNHIASSQVVSNPNKVLMTYTFTWASNDPVNDPAPDHAQIQYTRKLSLYASLYADSFFQSPFCYATSATNSVTLDSIALTTRSLSAGLSGGASLSDADQKEFTDSQNVIEMLPVTN